MRKRISDKKWLGSEGLQLILTFHTRRNREIQDCAGPFHGIVYQV